MKLRFIFTLTVCFLFGTSTIAWSSINEFSPQNEQKNFDYPDNNTPCGATEIQCGQTINGTFKYASESGFGTPCYYGIDVWYTFTGELGKIYRPKVTAPDSWRFGLAIYYANNPDCTTDFLEFIECGESFILTPQNEGDQFYVQIFLIEPFSNPNFSFSLNCYDITTDYQGNDEACDAILVNCNETIVSSFNGATLSDDLPNCAYESISDLWYKFIGEEGKTYKLIAEDYSKDVYLAVYNGEFCNTLNIEGCSDALAMFWGEAEITITPGFENQVFYIRVGSFIENNNFILTVTCSDIPENDTPCDAIEIQCGEKYIGDTYGATESTLGLETCISMTNYDVWYKFEITNDTDFYSIRVGNNEDRNFEGMIRIFSGGCNELVLEDCFYVFEEGRYNVELHDFAQGTYYVQYLNYINSSSFSIELICQASPVNISSCEAQSIECGETLNGTTLGANFSGVTPSCYEEYQNYKTDIWYTFVGEEGKTYKVTLDSDQLSYKALTVYNGEFCEALNFEECSTRSFEYHSIVESVTILPTMSPTRYYIQVTTLNFSTDISIRLECVDLPENNSLCNAANIECGETVIGYTYGVVNGEEVGDCSDIELKALWYKFDADGESDYKIALEGLGDYDFTYNFSLFKGNCEEQVLIHCGNDELYTVRELEFDNLDEGTYYLQVYTSLYSSEFELSLSSDSCEPIPGTPSALENHYVGNIVFYPNPSNDIVYIDFQGVEKMESVTVINSMGQFIHQANVNSASNHQVDVSNYPNGMYYVMIDLSNGERIQHKIAVLK